MIQEIYKRFISSTGISTDTRKIEQGNIFFALRGPNFNANKFALKALQEGASYAVIDDISYATDDRFIVVEDTLQTLQLLANFHRKKFSIPVIGITGSNGKTTTKELMSSIMSTKYNVLATKGNLNNHIGVPLTLLEITDKNDIAIVEMGANKLGDIAELCIIAEPDHGIITNIGKAHIEGFGGFEGVIRGKSELYQWLIQKQGTVFINSGDTILANMARRFEEPVYYPGPGDYFHLELTEADPYVICKNEDETIFTTHLIGAYNFSNIAAALCIGKYFKVSASEGIDAVKSYIPENNRSQIITNGSNTIILDAYNANPSSMEAAIENLAKMKSNKKVVIMGDMLELGEQSDEEHTALGERIEELGFSSVFFCGKQMKLAHDACNPSYYYNSRNELEKSIKNHIFKECIILIKGSRGMQLEKIIDFIN